MVKYIRWLEQRRHLNPTEAEEVAEAQAGHHVPQTHHNEQEWLNSVQQCGTTVWYLYYSQWDSSIKVPQAHCAWYRCRILSCGRGINPLLNISPVHGIGAVSFTKYLTFPMMTIAKIAWCGRVINPLQNISLSPWWQLPRWLGVVGCQILYKTSHLPHDDNCQDRLVW